MAAGYFFCGLLFVTIGNIICIPFEFTLLTGVFLCVIMVPIGYSMNYQMET